MAFRPTPPEGSSLPSCLTPGGLVANKPFIRASDLGRTAVLQLGSCPEKTDGMAA